MYQLWRLDLTMFKAKIYNLENIKKATMILNRLEGNIRRKASKRIINRVLDRGANYAAQGREFAEVRGGSSVGGLRESVHKEKVATTHGELVAAAPHAHIIEHGGTITVEGYAFVPGKGMVRSPTETHVAIIEPRWWFRETAKRMDEDIESISGEEIDIALQDAVKI